MLPQLFVIVHDPLRRIVALTSWLVCPVVEYVMIGAVVREKVADSVPIWISVLLETNEPLADNAT